jgi:hypothetical protein
MKKNILTLGHALSYYLWSLFFFYLKLFFF